MPATSGDTPPWVPSDPGGDAALRRLTFSIAQRGAIATGDQVRATALARRQVRLERDVGVAVLATGHLVPVPDLAHELRLAG